MEDQEEKKISEEQQGKVVVYDETTVVTKSGPVRYKFTSNEDTLPSPPPIVVNIVTNKKSKKKKYESEEEEESDESPKPKRRHRRRHSIVAPPPPLPPTYEWVFQLIVVVLLIGMVGLYLSTHTPIQYHRPAASPPQRIMAVKTGFEHDTTSVDWDPLIHNDTKEMVDLLEHTLRALKRRVLCMHHLKDFENPYKACVVLNMRADQVYFMLNPWIRGGSVEKAMYQEKSIACKGETIVKRHDTIILEWMRPTGTALYAMFDDPEEAVMLQIVLDEFKGNLHCTASKTPLPDDPKGIEQERTKRDKGATQAGTSL